MPGQRGVSVRRSAAWRIGLAAACLLTLAAARKKNTDDSSSAPAAAPAVTALPPVSAPQSPAAAPSDSDRGWSKPALGVAAVLALAALAAAGAGDLRDAGLAAVVAATAAYWGFGGWRYHKVSGDEQGYAPVQPIAFSHALHAGKLQISCLYCHGGAARSDFSDVPSPGICMNCHVAVHSVAGSNAPSPEIAKLLKVYETHASSAPAQIPWIRVHHLPDYVHFSHRVHVNNNISCQECHGPVQTMTRVRQYSSLSMGWCINCHRLTPETAPKHWKKVGGPLDCAACHY